MTVVEDDLTPWPTLVATLYRLAWPAYACECCVGQEPWQGCYCRYHRCVAPSVGPPLPVGHAGFFDQSGREIFVALARALFGVVARRTGHYHDPDRD